MEPLSEKEIECLKQRLYKTNALDSNILVNITEYARLLLTIDIYMQI